MLTVALIGDYPIDPQVVPGGVSAVSYYLVKGLARLDDVDLHMISCQSGLSRDSLQERDGASVHFLAESGHFNFATNWYLPRRKIAEVVRRIRPDILHAQGLGLPAAAVLALGLPYAATVHGIIWKEKTFDMPSWYQQLRGRFHARIAYNQVRRLRNVFITSGYAARMLPQDREYQQFVINNPVGDEIFEVQSRPDAPHVLVVGGTRQRKDPMTAVRVMQRVLQRLPTATMHMIGPPSGTDLDRQIVDYLRQHGLDDRIEVLGLVTDDVLRQQYAKASVLLMTSLEETAPVAISEAFAVGLPVVGTDAGGVPYMVSEGETGFIRPAGDVIGLAERVLAVLEDSALRQRLADAAKQTGRRHFALDAIARKTVDAYREILGSW